ncbi:MFS transporter [Erythrobacter sp. THAF29]|uniref:spinster family MFS transporter n=1 Tax=Erythrobacter sp. THAF29 TaxID=2587851 RepID=UPI001269571F|nr:MFS transporter [Erythrobacter sp. THAF29]QFT76223.1 L-galactonate transporter [Erythrobacter sp. THAF29]
MASTPDHTTDRPVGGLYRWYVLALLTLTSLFSVADRLVFSILTQDIKGEFALSDLELGLLGGVAFSIIYVIAGFPAARLADRSVRKNIIAAAISFWSIMTALCGLAIGFWTLFLARIGVGVGEGCSGPASQSLIADFFRPEELARAMGILTIGATMGTAFGLMAGGLLAEAFGWRMAFVLMGLPGVLIGALLYFTVREPQRGRYARKGARIEQLPLGETLGSLLSNRVYLGFAAGFAVQIMIGYGMAFWVAPAAIRQYGVSTGDVAVFLGLAYIAGGLPGPLIGGFLTEKLTAIDERWRAWFPGLVSLLSVGPLWLAFQMAEFWPFLILFAVGYGIFVASQAGILSGIQNAVEPSQRGFAVAFALCFNNILGQAVGLGLIGWISDSLAREYGVNALGIAVVGVCAAAGIGAIVLFVWTASQMRPSGYLAKIGAD